MDVPMYSSSQLTIALEDRFVRILEPFEIEGSVVAYTVIGLKAARM